MRTSQLFAPTLRQLSAEVELASHQLLLRAGYVRQLAAGIYSLLPLGLRVLHNLEGIVREEIDRAGAQEVLLPALQPLELWERTGRAAAWGDELLQLEDRGGRRFALGPTHEEVVTSLVGASARSYRQLPFTLYQIQTKFRDDPRPRGGLVRLREFIMKDAYSFDRDAAGLDRSYEAMHAAYHRLLQRLGLPYHVVHASGGAIGGWDTREFHLPAEAGESHYLLCEGCGYAAAPEVAPVSGPGVAFPREDMAPLARAETPNQRTIEQVTAFLGLPASRLVKTLIYEAGDRLLAALVHGDREVSEDKLRAELGLRQVRLADPAVVLRVTGASVGFSGPVGLPETVQVLADDQLQASRNVVRYPV